MLKHQNNLCGDGLDQGTESSVLVDLEDPEPSPPQQTVKLDFRPLHGTGEGEHLQVEHVLEPLALFVQDRVRDVQAAALGF